MRITILALLAALLSGMVGLQLLAALPLIPDGNRLFVIGGNVLAAGTGIGTLALIYLIPRANRSVLSYLKAFIVVGSLVSLSQCSTWIDRFHGAPKRISDPATKLSLEVPSDWALAPDSPPNVHFALSDWAGTEVVAVTRGDELPPDMEPDDAIARVLVMQREQAEARMGAPVDRFPCGPGCSGDVYLAEARGKQMKLYTAAMVRDRTLILLHATQMTGASREDPEALLRILRSVRIAPP